MASTTFTAGTNIASAWLNDVNTKTYLTDIHPKMYLAAGDGVTDDLSRFVSAFAVLSAGGGGNIMLMRGAKYRISSKLTIPSNCGIIGDGTATIYVKAADFNNTNPAVHYTSNSAILDGSGLTVSPYTPSTNIRLRNFKIEFEIGDGRCVDAIVVRNCNNLEIHGVEIFNGCTGAGIKVSSLSGKCVISNNHIHDWTTATTYSTQPQTTGIELDGDRVNSIPCVGVIITENRIQDLTMTGAALAAYGQQTDGINIQGAYPNYSAHCVVGANVITNVAEGIDNFGSYNLFMGNTMKNIYDYGYKFIHGASFNIVDGGSIFGAGRAGIGVFGSNVIGVGNTDRNCFSDITIVDINPSNRAVSNPAAFMIDDAGGATGKPTGTTVSGGNWSLGQYGQYGYIDVSTLGGNVGDNLQINKGTGTVKKIRVDSAASVVRQAGNQFFMIDDTITTIASAGNITPIADVHFVSGVATIQDINRPARFTEYGQIVLIPTGVWSTNALGNIALASTAVVGKAMTFTWNSGTSKWYPSY